MKGVTCKAAVISIKCRVYCDSDRFQCSITFTTTSTAMARPSLAFTDLASLLEIINASDTGSTRTAGNDSGSEEAELASVALSNILNLEAPLGVEEAADFFAEKLGLKPKNGMVQTGVFVLTKVAILETAQMVGIGGGLAKLDLAAFQMAQLKKQVEEINKKLDVILSTPLKQAVVFFGKAMRHMENESISGTVKEMENVRRNAIQEAVVALCAAGAHPNLGESPLTDSGISKEMKNLIREQLSL